MQILKVQDVKKIYSDGIVGIDSFNFYIDKKAIISIVGPENSGKTSVLKIIAGIEEPTHGQVYIDGKNINEMSVHNKKAEIIFKNCEVYPNMTVFDNIMFELKIKDIDYKQVEKHIDTLIQILDLKNILSSKAKTLDKLQKQCLILAKSAVKMPTVLLIEDMMNGLNVELKKRLKEHIVKLHKSLDITIIYESKDPMEIFDISDYIIVMKKGCICQKGTPLEVYSNPKNVFVAGFLGMPQMNFFESRITQYGKDYFISIGENFIKLLNKNIGNKISQYVNKDIIGGIRPEDVCIFGYKNLSSKLIPAKIQLIERNLNGDCYYLNISNLPITSCSGLNEDYKIDDDVYVDINAEKVNVFDINQDKIL